MSEALPSTKAQWRDWAKRTRAALPTKEHSHNLVAHLNAWKVYQHAKHILIYLAFGSEVDLSELQEDSSKTFYVTRTWKERETLSLHPLSAGLERHPYGYLQPPQDAPLADATKLELALVPGLCFDKKGTRLGYGKGYYDRLLPTLNGGVPRVGISSEALIVPELPRDPYDIPMTHLITENCLYDLHERRTLTFY